jgi:hypothetical protein
MLGVANPSFTFWLVAAEIDWLVISALENLSGQMKQHDAVIALEGGWETRSTSIYPARSCCLPRIRDENEKRQKLSVLRGFLGCVPP